MDVTGVVENVVELIPAALASFHPKSTGSEALLPYLLGLRVLGILFLVVAVDVVVLDAVPAVGDGLCCCCALIVIILS